MLVLLNIWFRANISIPSGFLRPSVLSIPAIIIVLKLSRFNKYGTKFSYIEADNTIAFAWESSARYLTSLPLKSVEVGTAIIPPFITPKKEIGYASEFLRQTNTLSLGFKPISWVKKFETWSDLTANSLYVTWSVPSLSSSIIIATLFSFAVPTQADVQAIPIFKNSGISNFTVWLILISYNYYNWPYGQFSLNVCRGILFNTESANNSSSFVKLFKA